MCTDFFSFTWKGSGSGTGSEAVAEAVDGSGTGTEAVAEAVDGGEVVVAAALAARPAVWCGFGGMFARNARLLAKSEA